MSQSGEPAPNTASKAFAGGRTRRPQRWARLAGGGAASVGEQGLFAGTHLLINIMLARWLPIEEYGVFVLVYSVVVFLNALHTAVVAEPVAVFWGENLGRTRAFVGESLSLNLAFAAISTVAGLAGAGILIALDFMPLRAALLAPLLAVAMPMYWYVRQAAYADLSPWAAFVRSAVYGGGFVFGVLALKLVGVTSAESALAAMGIAATIASLAGSTKYWARPARFKTPEVQQFAVKAWTYGRWSAPAGALMWVANNIFIITLPLASTVADSGRLKMVLNLLLPFQQVLLGLSLVGLPILARLHSNGQAERATRLTRLALTAALAGGGAFSAAVALGGEEVFTWIYGSRRASDAPLVNVGIALPIAWALIAVSRTALRAEKRVKSIFVGYGAGLLLGGIPAGLLFLPHGAKGALIATTTAYIAIALLLLSAVIWRGKA